MQLVLASCREAVYYRISSPNPPADLLSRLNIYIQLVAYCRWKIGLRDPQTDHFATQEVYKTTETRELVSKRNLTHAHIRIY